MVFHTARVAPEKQVRPPACRKCFQRADKKVGEVMLILQPTYQTRVYESDDGYIVIKQEINGEEESVVLSVEQAEIVGKELLRLVEATITIDMKQG